MHALQRTGSAADGPSRPAEVGCCPTDVKRLGAERLPIHATDHRFGFEFALCDHDPAADCCVVPQPGSNLVGFYVRQAELAPPESAEAALGRLLA